jgi:hypothetical protein
MWRKILLALVPLGLVVLALGCKREGAEPVTVPSPATPVATEGEHAHKAGAHGGSIVPIGRDNYHAEAIFEKDGHVRLYTLGPDEAREQEVEVQTLSAFVKRADAPESTSMQFRPQPQKEDSAGKTSQFVGQLPPEYHGRKVELSIRIAIAGERYRFSVQSPGADHGEEMPAKVVSVEERKLYLTPGGKYTQTDIKANGERTPSEAFAGMTPSHDTHPQRGDKVCPISETKANPRFTWVIGGQRYEFCCPPCIDEFVTLAKEHPEQIKDAATYLKK